jgi:Cupin domain
VQQKHEGSIYWGLLRRTVTLDESLRANPEELAWNLADPAQPSMGARTILFGKLDAPGFYALRLRLDKDYPGGRPHWHPDSEFGTVIEGSLYVATGERLTRASAKRLTAGAFIFIPPRLPHAIWADEKVVLQIMGPGPRVTAFEEA